MSAVLHFSRGPMQAKHARRKKRKQGAGDLDPEGDSMVPVASSSGRVSELDRMLQQTNAGAKEASGARADATQ